VRTAESRDRENRRTGETEKGGTGGRETRGSAGHDADTVAAMASLTCPSAFCRNWNIAIDSSS